MDRSNVLDVQFLTMKEGEALAGRLLDWYDRNARALPWREDHSPYRVWVSEIMLQQTRVETVIPYFERFMSAFPTVKALAEAKEFILMKCWEGLGYYSRARNLQKAARQVMERYDGRMPATYEKLLTLPGIGAYTAGAVASIAFGLPAAAVDGNVLRVFSRILASDADIGDPKVKQAYQEMVLQLQPNGRPGDFNQAVMDLGATVCLPNGAPKCLLCPVGSYCRAAQEGQQALYPVKAPKKPRAVEERTILLVHCGGEALLLQRPKKGLLAGLWEFWNINGILDQKQIEAAVGARGGDAVKITDAGKARHIFTHMEWRMQGWAVAVRERFDSPDGAWAGLEEIQKSYTVPTAFQAYTRQLERFLG